MASAATARAATSWTWPKKFKAKTRKPRYWQLIKAKDANETEFDHECRRLKLEGASMLHLKSSVALRHWAKRYAKLRYVPTDLLSAWGITVNFDMDLNP